MVVRRADVWSPDGVGVDGEAGEKVARKAWRVERRALRRSGAVSVVLVLVVVVMAMAFCLVGGGVKRGKT